MVCLDDDALVDRCLLLRRWGRRSDAARKWRIIGLPGDGALKHVRIDRGKPVTVCRDADIGNPATEQAVADGLDSLLLQA